MEITTNNDAHTYSVCVCVCVCMCVCVCVYIYQDRIETGENEE